MTSTTEQINADLLQACKWFISQLENGDIVRDISRDSKADWVPRMCEFTTNLQKAVAAVAKAEEFQEQ